MCKYVYIYNMTHSHVCRDSFTCVPSLIHMSDITKHFAHLWGAYRACTCPRTLNILLIHLFALIHALACTPAPLPPPPPLLPPPPEQLTSTRCLVCRDSFRADWRTKSNGGRYVEFKKRFTSHSTPTQSSAHTHAPPSSPFPSHHTLRSPHT